MASALIWEEYGLTMKSARENIPNGHRFLAVIAFSQVVFIKEIIRFWESVAINDTFTGDQS